MKLLDLEITNPIISGNAKVESTNGTLTFSLDDKFFTADSVEYITVFSPGILNISFSSILIGGLNMGLIPYYIENNFTGVEIDVVESNTGVIEVVNEMGHLSQNVNILHADPITYSTTKKYDLILMDIWWFDNQQTVEDKSTIISNYSNNLNTGGKFYFPIIKELI